MISYQFIDSPSKLNRFLDEIEEVSWIAYDTEFISEGRYQAEFCLAQVATHKGNYLIDPIKIGDLKPFWERICRDDTTSIVHACRSELEFCFRAIGRFPTRIFDVQLAAAFVGYEYPLNFKTLTHETIGVDIEKTETRTDWSRRPLLTGQLEYALNDVVHLDKIRNFLNQKLENFDRVQWFEEEMRNFCDSLMESFTEERWRKLLGNKRYSRDELAIVRELWEWRRQKALDKNTAPSRIFRDDMILEVAKHKTCDPQLIANIRGIRSLPGSNLVKELCAAIEVALALPEDKKPRMTQNHSYPQYSLATQLFNVLIGQYCRNHSLASRIVATVADVRKMIAFYDGTLPKGEFPKLLEGWRKSFLGSYIDDFIKGRCLMQFSDQLEDHPLKVIRNNFCYNGEDKETST